MKRRYNYVLNELLARMLEKEDTLQLLDSIMDDVNITPYIGAHITNRVNQLNENFSLSSDSLIKIINIINKHKQEIENSKNK